MTGIPTPTHFRPRRPSAFPLLLAGAALVLALTTTADRFNWFRPGPEATPRTVTPRGELASYEKDVIGVFGEVSPSVVHITTETITRDFWGRRYRQQDGSGSGFVWDDSGTIVTNDHVVQGKNAVTVAFPDGTYQGEVIARSPRHDIAVVRLLELPRNLKPIQVGTSHDLEIGQTALAIGNPYGLDHTLTVGVISQLDRTIKTTAGATLRGVIQTDAAINPGNSGGPLLDSAGRLIGMNTAIRTETGGSVGIGFAVPVDTINQVVPLLLDSSKVRRDLGIEGESVRLGRRTFGYDVGIMIVDFVGPGAREAGLEVFGPDRMAGDVIIRVDGRHVRSMSDIRQVLATRLKGDKVAVRFLRIAKGDFQRLETQVEIR